MWVEQSITSIRAEYVLGVDNVLTDWLSQKELDQSEWRLHHDVFLQLDDEFGPLDVNLFTSRESSQLSRYFFRERDPQAEGIDALHFKWPPRTHYAFPSVKLLPRVIAKVRKERVLVLLIAPHWPRRSWFMDLRELSMIFPFTCLPGPSFAGPVLHPQPLSLSLHAWLLKGYS